MSRGFKIILCIIFGGLLWISIVDILAAYLYSRN